MSLRLEPCEPWPEIVARPGAGVTGADTYRLPVIAVAPRFVTRKLLDLEIQVEGEVKFKERDRLGSLCGSTSAN